MKRPLVLLFVPVIAFAAWLAFQWLDGGSGLAPAQASADAARSQVDDAKPVAPGAAVAPGLTSEVAAERVAAPGGSDAGGDAPPIPEDCVWLDVRAIDAATRQPVAGAEVRWATSATWQQVARLPMAERKEYDSDQEAAVSRFGWSTRTDGDGMARVAGDRHGANVFARSEGRYATGYVGGSREVPAGGWLLELEADRTLRVRVLDALGRPAIGSYVGIRMFGQDGQPVPNRGWIRPLQAKAPDASVEWKHQQMWLWQGGKRRVHDVVRWQVVAEVLAFDEASSGGGVDFDVEQPPREVVELRLPPTGRIAARLLHEGQVLTKDVTFQVRRGADPERLHTNFSPRYPVQADGWSRVPFVGLGGELVVVARVGHAEVSREVAAPLGQDQEVRVELTTEELFVLSGRFLGPDRQPLADAEVEVNFDLGVMSGGGVSVATDAQGRFVWLLTKGHVATARIERLVFSQRFADESPRSVTVAPREISRGTNDLGVLALVPEALVVGGRMVFDVPPSAQRVWFQLEALQERRGRSGEERWSRVESLTQSQQPDGRFEVRGQTKPTRYRLTFPSMEHLPIAPVEFRIGQDDLVVPVVVGSTVAASCLLAEGTLSHLIRGVLVPGFEPPAEHQTGEFDFYGHDNRYQAEGWGPNGERCRLRWAGLPPGKYALQITAVGLVAPLATIEDVVLPLPEGGDPRLVDIDLRGAVRMLEVQLGNVPSKVDGRGGSPVLLFTLPQADEQSWQGLQFHEQKVQLPVVSGPLELMVLGGNCRPQRVQLSAEQVAAGKVTIDLRPWPTVELLVSGVPELPEGVSLHAYCSRPSSAAREARRFTAMGYSGGLDGFFDVEGHGVVEHGRVTIPIGDGTRRIGVYLRKAGTSRTESLRSITPGEIVGGDGLAPIPLQLSSEEVRAALEKLAGAGK